MARTTNQPTRIPTRKVAAATAGSMAGAIVGGYLAAWFGAPFDTAVVTGGWPVLGAFIAGYVAREWAPRSDAFDEFQGEHV